MFHSLAQHLAQRSPLDLFRTTLIVPDGFDRGAFTRCLIEALPTEAGILPQVLTIKEFMQQLGMEEEDNLFALTDRIRTAFPKTSLMQSVQKAQFLLRLQAFCFQFGGSLNEPPFPLLSLSPNEASLVELLRRDGPLLSDRLRDFFQRRSDESFIWVDPFPSIPLFEAFRTAFQKAGHDVWTPPLTSPRAASVATFSSLTQEAAGVVRVLASLSSSKIQSPVVAIITDHEPLLQRIEAELLSDRISFKKPSQPTLADSVWGEAFIAVASWMAHPSAATFMRMGAFFAQRATPARAAWFRSFVQKIIRAPSLLLDGDLWIPEQADESDLRFIMAKKESADSDVTRGFDALVASRVFIQQDASWCDRVQAHQTTWNALRSFWGENGGNYPDLADFFAFLREGVWEDPLSAEAYETMVRLLMTRVSAPEHLALPEHASVLLLSARQAPLYDFDVAIFAGMNEGQGVAETGFPPLFQKPEAWDYILQEALIRQAASGRTVMMTRTDRPGSRPSALFNAWPEVAEAVEASVWTLDAPISAPSHVVSTARAFVPKNARPRTLAVSDLQRLKDDPYAFFARKILRLYPVVSPSLSVDFGRWTHDFLHRYFRDGAWAAGLSLSAFFDTNKARHPAVVKRFRPRLRPMLERIDADLAKRQPERIQTEVRLEVPFPLDGCVFTVYGIADRIDTKAEDVLLFDYKTGALPSEGSIQKLDTLQLPVEALLLKRKKESPVSPEATIELCPFSLKYDPGKASEVRLPFSPTLEAQTQAEIVRLLGLLAAENFVFETPATASNPSSEYQHLKRIST